MSPIFKIYSESLKFLQKHPIVFVFTILYIFPNFINVWLYQNNAGLVVLLLNFFSLAIGNVLELYIVVYVFRESKILRSSDTPTAVIRKYFWKAFGLGIYSLFAVVALLSPLCLLMYYFSLSETQNFQAILLVILLFGITFLSLGIQSLGLRIMIRYNKGVVESMIAGFKELFHHFQFYFILYSVWAFLMFFPIAMSLFIGTTKTELNLFSSPVIPPWEFLNNYQHIMSYSGSKMIRMFISVLVVPLNHVAVTLAYINRKS